MRSTGRSQEPSNAGIGAAPRSRGEPEADSGRTASPAPSRWADSGPRSERRRRRASWSCSRRQGNADCPTSRGPAARHRCCLPGNRASTVSTPSARRGRRRTAGGCRRGEAIAQQRGDLPDKGLAGRRCRHRRAAARSQARRAGRHGRHRASADRPRAVRAASTGPARARPRGRRSAHRSAARRRQTIQASRSCAARSSAAKSVSSRTWWTTVPNAAPTGSEAIGEGVRRRGRRRSTGSGVAEGLDLRLVDRAWVFGLGCDVAGARQLMQAGCDPAVRRAGPGEVERARERSNGQLRA